MNLSIEITKDQHRAMKALAAIQGKSVNQYILDAVLPEIDEKAAREKLTELLKQRSESAERGNISNRSVDEIVSKVLREEFGE